MRFPIPPGVIDSNVPENSHIFILHNIFISFLFLVVIFYLPGLSGRWTLSLVLNFVQTLILYIEQLRNRFFGEAKICMRRVVRLFPINCSRLINIHEDISQTQIYSYTIALHWKTKLADCIEESWVFFIDDYIFFVLCV